MVVTTLGVIPARGGSKGIPRKNIAPLRGRPLIQYTIEAAGSSRLLSRVLVSSEDDEIIKIAQELGAEVPFRRPADLAGDDATALAVACHAVKFVEEEEERVYDFVALLEPTAPLRKAQDIDEALGLLYGSGADSVAGVCRLEAPHPAKLKVIEGGSIRPFLPNLWREGLKRQDLEPVYFLNGAIYAVRRDVLVEKRTFWGERTIPYIMPPERSVNIDTWLDLRLAEALMERGALGGNAG
jgi:CMP-N-acetylneuraminic acid synthetase